MAQLRPFTEAELHQLHATMHDIDEASDRVRRWLDTDPLSLDELLSEHAAWHALVALQAFLDVECAPHNPTTSGMPIDASVT
jgi:hypothetical protein